MTHLGVSLQQLAHGDLLGPPLLQHEEQAGQEDLLLGGDATCARAQAGGQLAPVHLPHNTKVKRWPRSTQRIMPMLGTKQRMKR